MTDLTAITTPFGLLDEETRRALRAHGGPYEGFTGDHKGLWTDVAIPGWVASSTYRVKPQPPKPREWWIREGDESVIPYCEDTDGSFARNKFIRVREVV